jgi:predicted TIM-barrel fold metal-dependent hydrolase
MIDGHVHVWTLEPERYAWQPTLAHVPIPTRPATAEALIAEMDQAGVSRTVLVQHSVYGWDNSYLCDCLERYPERFAGICLVDPRSERAADDLRYWCQERGCHGVRLNLIAELDASWALGPARQVLWQAAADLGIPVALQMLPAQAAVALELAARHPGVNLVLDYMGAAAYHDGTGLAAVGTLSQAPNISIKVIAAGPDSREAYPFRDLWPLYEGAVARFGPDRIVFGTDYPHVLTACSYPDAIRWLGELPFLDDAGRALVADGNARRLWWGDRA